MANSKKKGNKGEREVSKWWEQWTGLEFSRVPASGGLRWSNTQNITGDILCSDKIHSRRFLFCIESKNYKDINFEHLILGNKNVKILDFWQQTKDDAERGNKIPILFMKYDRMPKNTYFVVVSRNLFSFLTAEIEHDFDYFIVPKQDFVILNSNDLLKVKYLTSHKQLKKLKRNGQTF